MVSFRKLYQNEGIGIGTSIEHFFIVSIVPWKPQ